MVQLLRRTLPDAVISLNVDQKTLVPNFTVTQTKHYSFHFIKMEESELGNKWNMKMQRCELISNDKSTDRWTTVEVSEPLVGGAMKSDSHMSFNQGCVFMSVPCSTSCWSTPHRWYLAKKTCTAASTFEQTRSFLLVWKHQTCPFYSIRCFLISPDLTPLSWFFLASTFFADHVFSPRCTCPFFFIAGKSVGHLDEALLTFSVWVYNGMMKIISCTARVCRVNH